MKQFKNKYYIIIATLIVAIIIVTIFWIKYIRNKVNTMNTNNNVKAFLIMIRTCEGTAKSTGYQTLFGGKLFSDFSKHPNIRVPFGKNNYSTAAGAYQILYRTWLPLSIKLGLTDFSPESQDKCAIELIREKGALNDVVNGNFESAINKIRKVWASMPNAGYGQPEKSIAFCKNIYQKNGGQIA